MATYVATIPCPPRTLTEVEQAALLKVTGDHRAGFRDHVILALALGTGLREHEIAALNVGDIVHTYGRVRRRVALRVFKRASADPAPQEVFMPDSLSYKLAKFVAWKKTNGEDLRADAPLFVSRLGQRSCGRVTCRRRRLRYCGFNTQRSSRRGRACACVTARSRAIPRMQLRRRSSRSAR